MIKISRHFTKLNQTIDDVFDSVEWSKRSAILRDIDGTEVFRQDNVEFPTWWSDGAVTIVASKYFWGQRDTAEREYSLKQLINRVVSRIAQEGVKRNYFNSSEDAGYVIYEDPNSYFNIFKAELAYMVMYQMFAWNSPVWFNIGTTNPQAVSACYITQVDDNLQSIAENAVNEMMIFKDGSGNGFNASRMRGSNEHITGGGHSSGPLSFMQVYDKVAFATKSGGRSRRAAKMVIMNVDHPDIEEFIRCKSLEELKMKALIAAGYDKSPGGEAAMTVAFQNANHSVRITDKFLDAVENNEDWHLINRTDGKIAKTLKARDLWNLIAQEAWETGDPGIQFDDLIQEWHTCKADGPIEATNPCAEYVFLNNTSCNLASFNLLKFRKDDSSFDIDGFIYGIQLGTISMNILIDFADFPVEKIAEGTRKYRTIGIGYANLGGLLMSMGIAYDSDEGRNLAASITSLMTAQTYLTSSDVAEFRGPFERFKDNKAHMYRIIAKHYDYALDLTDDNDIAAMAANLWGDVLHDTDFFANAQATVLAPTGTIGLMMECDTTGVEPELSLVKYKKLVDGGNLKYVNDCVRSALTALGYAQSSIELVINTIRDEGRLHEVIIPEHRNVFACSFEGVIDCPVLSPQSHVKMLGAVAPFLSGSASKTCNLPETATVQDIQDIYNLAHSLGVKCIAVYRDNCKQSQPLTTKDPNAKKEEVKPVVVESVKRKKLPNDRDAKTHKFEIAGHEGYITVGLYPDGSLGEVFIRMNKGGSFANGMMDSYAIAMSLGLQHGVPIETFINKFKHVSFEPFGWTDNPQIRVCKSPVDYLARYLELKFCNTTEKVEIENDLHFATAVVEKQQPKIVNVANIDHGSACSYCGHIKIRIGKCERCLNCGEGGECGA